MPPPHRATTVAGYDRDFYSASSVPARACAEIVVPWLLEWMDVSSVVDVGCGVGSWLRCFHERGIDVTGIDGRHVDVDDLEIPTDDFLAVDLLDPPRTGRRFDLAMSLEVAEHLPPSAADAFVAYLVGLAPFVLFSAAVPGQGGVHHVNEQWPTYWSDRFSTHGFEAVDVVRPLLWDRLDDGGGFYYAQNTLLYCAPSDGAQVPAHLPRLTVNPAPLALVHPELLRATQAHARRPSPPPLAELLRSLPAATRRAFGRRIRRRRAPA